MSARAAILEVDDLFVTFATGQGDVEAVRGVSFAVGAGERVGIAGESGSGKTVSALAITGLLAPSARSSGTVRFQGSDVGSPGSRARRDLRGRHVGTILQDPLSSLNPALTVGCQITEALRRHLRLDRAAARKRAIELLGLVGIPDPARNVDEYPHRFSGGMRQRAMIAIALSCEPELVVADEPTTALDVTVQAQILELLVSLCDERNTALLLITHDLGVLAGVAHRILVMYAGKVVEAAEVDDLFQRPEHAHTRALLASIPRADRPAAHAASATPKPVAAPLLEVRGLTKVFPIVRGGAIRRTVGALKAVDDVSLTIGAGETLALVGESGSGKSTFARCVLRLTEPSAGSVRFDGRDVLACDRQALRRLRHDMQIVFQDPYGSLDPRMTVEQLVAEPLLVHGLGGDRAGRRARVAELLRMVGLTPDHAARHPRAFSGGQRQRIAIARALATEPKLLVLDEPVSALDASTRGQVLALLADLQRRLGVSYLLVAHDLALVRSVADRVAVMYLGRIVESATSEQLFAAPAHPYTQALLSAVPVPDPERERKRRRIVLRGEATPAAAGACPFEPRCGRAQERCREEDPTLDEFTAAGHRAACFFATMKPTTTEDSRWQTPSASSMAMYCTGCIPAYQLPCFAGASEDIFRRHDLNVEILDPLPQGENILAVAEGRQDLCLTSVAHFLAVRRQHPDLEARFIFMVARHSHMGVFFVRGRPAAHGASIESYAELDGASLLGHPDTPFGREYEALLRHLGAQRGPAVALPYVEIERALAEGRGDVAADFVDLQPRFQAAADPFGVQIDCLAFHAAGIDIYGSGLVTSTRLLRERPQTVQAAVAAFREALLASREQPRLGLEALLDAVPAAEPELVLAGWAAGAELIFGAETSPVGTMNADKWRRTIAYHADAHGGPSEIDVTTVFDDSALVAAGAV